MRLLQESIILLRLKRKFKTSSEVKSAVIALSDEKVLPVNNPRAPKLLSKKIKLFKRKAAKQKHSDFLYALRRLGLYEAWKKRRLRRMPELSKITMCFHVLNFLGLNSEIRRIKARFFSLINVYKTRLKWFKDKPNYVHLQKIYRAALNKVFKPYLGRCRITVDSAIIGLVLRTRDHALRPDYSPQLWGVDLNKLANTMHHWVRMNL